MQRLEAASGGSTSQRRSHIWVARRCVEWGPYWTIVRRMQTAADSRAAAAWSMKRNVGGAMLQQEGFRLP